MVPRNEAAIWAARQHWASCSFLAAVQLVRFLCRNTKFLKEHLVHVPGVPSESFVFLEGDLTSWTDARKLAHCWRAAQIAASFLGTIQWGFYHREAALGSRSGKIATVSLLIRWPINRFNRFSDFWRLDRLDRFGKIIKSIFSKFWKREFQFFRICRISWDFWSFGKIFFLVYNPNFL